MNIQVITASAFIYKDNRALIVKRSETETFAPGHWELPGGSIEYGETVEDGITREIKEETGLNVNLGNTFHQFTYVSDRSETHYIEVIVMANLQDPEQEVKLNPLEHSEYKWVTKEEFKGNFEDMFELERIAIEEGFLILSS